MHQSLTRGPAEVICTRAYCVIIGLSGLARHIMVFVCVFVFDTFFHHAYTETLLEAAVLAAISSPFVHRAVFTCQTHVLRILLHRPLQPPTIKRVKERRKTIS